MSVYLQNPIFALCLHLSLLAGCDRTPPEPENTSSGSGNPSSAGGDHPSGGSEATEGSSSGGAEDQGSTAGGGEGSGGALGGACIIPLADPPPPDATSLSDCPADPYGRPEMPRGAVTFVDAPAAPRLDVELALTHEHQTHGLMYRPELSDEEGMLFTYPEERILSFWMKNTCLALDLLFIDAGGVITGVLREVPPWNQTSRKISCPSAHVLEVRAGFTETYGVSPGQRIAIDGLP